MFAKAFSFGGLAVLAAATVLMTAEPGQAAPPGVSYRICHYGGYYRPYVRYYGTYPVYYPLYCVYDPYDPNYDWDYSLGLGTPARPVLTAEEKDVRSLLAASGVPTDEGRPVWPLALRVLPGQEAEALRGQIDALLQMAATQAARGRPSPDIVQELAQATDHLRKLLVRHREEHGGLTETSYEEAKRFLDKLGGARRLLRAQLAPAPSDEGKGGSDAPDHRP